MRFWILLGCLVTAAYGGSLETRELQAKLNELTRGFDGRVGISVESRSGSASVNGNQRFSLQSVVKMITSLAVMDQVDRGQWRLDDRVTVQRSDLSVFMQPIANMITEKGYQTTIADLIRRAVVDSDSAANDILMARLGGPAAVQAYLKKKKVSGMHVDRDERHLQTEILGMQWRPEYVDEKVFRAAIDKVPEERRDDYYQRYQKDERDTSTPVAMATLLLRLAEGKLLSPASTKHLTGVMEQTVTFPDRLKGGLSSGWTLAHKTGTSGGWKGVVAATNDVGILTAPDGGRLGIAVFIGDSKETQEKRAALMAQAAKLAIGAYR